jgi:hypothetical protein
MAMGDRMSARELGTIWLSDFLFMIGGAFGVGLPIAILIIWISS